MNALPVDEALPRLKEALAGGNAAVLVAPPGAGKTTRVPLALLDAPWLGGRKIVMQEPRRLAARAAARRMAATLGEPVGETVGYRVRLDSKVGSAHAHRGRHRRSLPAHAAGRSCARRHRLRDLRRVARARAGDRPFLRPGARGADGAARGPARDRHVGDPRSRAGVAKAGRRAGDRERGPHVPGRHALSRSRIGRPHRGCRGVRGAAGTGGGKRQRARLPAGRRRDPPGRGASARPRRRRRRGAALRRPVAGRPGPRHRALARRAAQGRAGDLDRRDQPHHRGRAHRGRWRADADAALLAALGHDAAGDRAREPGLGRPAPRPRRPARTRRVLPPVDRGGAARPAALHPARDPRRRPGAAGARAGAVGRERCARSRG